MKRANRFETDLQTPIAEIGERFILADDYRTRFDEHSEKALVARTGKSFVELDQDEHWERWDDTTRALLVETACRKRERAAIDTLLKYESALLKLFGGDQRLTDSVHIYTNIAFNLGYEAGTTWDSSASANLRRGKEMRALQSAELNRVRATKRRRAIGEPTRQRARELMKRKPHLSWTACANEIADGRDGKGVREVIKELFPMGADGKRKYDGGNPAEPPADAPDRL